MKPATRMVCLRCGLGLAWWLGDRYKHLASGSTQRSCGQKPLPVLRSHYEGSSYHAKHMRIRGLRKLSE